MRTHTILFIQLLYCFFLAANLSAQDAITADITSPTFNNNCQNGNIDLHITGGFSPYDVVWYRVIPGIPQNYEQVIQESYGVQGDNDGEDLENIGNDRYKVVVTDALCGTANKSFSIYCICNDDCTLSANVTDANCGKNGAIQATVNCTEEGHTPFFFRWKDLAPGQNNSPNRDNLNPGTYCLVASDKDDCDYEKCWTVANLGIQIEVQLIDKKNIIFCKGREDQWNCTGSLEIAVSSGTTIEWQGIPNPGQTSSTQVSDLCAGTYTLIVSSGACSISETYRIECCELIEDDNEYSVEPISISAEVSPISNPTSMDGSIHLTISGGTQEIHFEWTGPNNYSSNSKNINNLALGTYCVRVFDGCSEEQKCFEIVDCDLNLIFVTGDIVKTCNGVAAGSITLMISGGTAPYTVSWDSGLSGSTI